MPGLFDWCLTLYRWFFIHVNHIYSPLDILKRVDVSVFFTSIRGARRCSVCFTLLEYFVWRS